MYKCCHDIICTESNKYPSKLKCISIIFILLLKYAEANETCMYLRPILVYSSHCCFIQITIHVYFVYHMPRSLRVSHVSSIELYIL